MEEIDNASRKVEYDLRRKMSYFKIVVNTKYTSGDLFNEVQKFIHMIELYHINLRSNIADFQDQSDSESSEVNDSKRIDLEQSKSITGAFTDKHDYTIRELIEGKIKREHSK